MRHKVPSGATSSNFAVRLRKERLHRRCCGPAVIGEPGVQSPQSFGRMTAPVGVEAEAPLPDHVVGRCAAFEKEQRAGRCARPTPECPRAWMGAVDSSLPPLHGCKSGTASDRAPPRCLSSSEAGVIRSRADETAASSSTGKRREAVVGPNDRSPAPTVTVDRSPGRRRLWPQPSFTFRVPRGTHRRAERDRARGSATVGTACTSGPRSGRRRPQRDRGPLAGVNGQVVDDFMATGAVVAGRGTFEPADGWAGAHHDGVPASS